jgi:hypothetical protein
VEYLAEELNNKDTQLEKLKKENDDLNRNYFKLSYILFI